MVWSQVSQIYAPDGNKSWSRSHAQAPTAIKLDSFIRVYFGTRDAKNKSRTGFVDLNLQDPTKILRVSETPVLDLGEPGTFDEDGAIPSCVMRVGNEIWMYYGGVSRGVRVPYRMSIGLARSRDNGLTFERVYQGPIVDRTPDEPFMTMAPNVMVRDKSWLMWYGSGIGWRRVGKKFEPLYQIKVAQSLDGINWERPNFTCIQQNHENEANTRPSVVEGKNGFEMWFSYRDCHDYRDGSGSYRIGHATSKDGYYWHRSKLSQGLDPSGTGWNSVTMSYPHVLEVGEEKYIFYNGNGFGRTGFGVARWVND